MTGFIDFLCVLVGSVAKLLWSMRGCVLAYIVFMLMMQIMPLVVYKAPYSWDEVEQMERRDREWPEN